jgi:hypothetical protein
MPPVGVRGIFLVLGVAPLVETRAEEAPLALAEEESRKPTKTADVEVVVHAIADSIHSQKTAKINVLPRP